MKKKIRVKQTKPIVWNTNKKGSWEKYYNKTDKNEKLDEAAESKSNAPNELSKTIIKEMSSIKYSCFGKVAFNRVTKEEKHLQKTQKEKIAMVENGGDVENVDKKLAPALLEVNKVNFERESKALRTIYTKKGKSAAVLNLKDRIFGILFIMENFFMNNN